MQLHRKSRVINTKSFPHTPNLLFMAMAIEASSILCQRKSGFASFSSYSVGDKPLLLISTATINSQMREGNKSKTNDGSGARMFAEINELLSFWIKLVFREGEIGTENDAKSASEDFVLLF